MDGFVLGVTCNHIKRFPSHLQRRLALKPTRAVKGAEENSVKPDCNNNLFLENFVIRYEVRDEHTESRFYIGAWISIHSFITWLQNVCYHYFKV